MVNTSQYATREEWLKETHRSIGASAGAGIVGLSNYASTYSAWVRFTEPLEIKPMEDIQRWGLLLEPAILTEFVRLSGVRAAQLPAITVHWDVAREHIHATLDAQADDGSPVELKTAHFAAAKVWGKEVPLQYMCQVQHQIHVTGAKCGYIAVLIDGYQFAWHRVPRHQTFIDRLMRRLDKFWEDHVVKRVPPPTDFSEATTAALLAKYPTGNGNAVELPSDLEPLYDEMEALTATEKSSGRRKDEIKNLIKPLIGEHTTGFFASGRAFKWAGENGSRRFTLGKFNVDSYAR